MASTSSSLDGEGEVFSLKKVRCVATWAWSQGGQENCAICKNPIMESCIECQARCVFLLFFCLPNQLTSFSLSFTLSFFAVGVFVLFDSTSANPDDCTVAWGSCEHGFHHHCIAKWLHTRKTCPLDLKTWEYKRFGTS